MGLFDNISKSYEDKKDQVKEEEKIEAESPINPQSLSKKITPENFEEEKHKGLFGNLIEGIKNVTTEVKKEKLTIVKSDDENFEEVKYTSVVKVPVAPRLDDYYGDTDIINLKNINQVYKNKDGSDHVIFKDFNFAVKDVKGRGQFVVILGASGCGKSTLLRYIAGLQNPTSGEILVHGKPKKSSDRIGMVFQQYSSFYWMKVIDNVALPLILKGVNKKEAREKAMDMIQLVGLDGHENKWAKYPILSGGQLQRVAIARSLMANSNILLLDEPFGALDVKTISQMEDLIIDVWLKMKANPTIIMVTHSVSQAVYLGDEIFILDANPGRVIHSTHVNLPVERNRYTKRDPRFIKTVQEIEDIMLNLG